MVDQSRQFRLVPFFSVASLASIVIAAAAMTWIFHGMAVRNVTEITESQNITLTHAMADALWPYYSAFLTTLSGTDGAEIRQRPEFGMLQENVRKRVQNLPILAVKIYDPDGLTVFSTVTEEIGRSKRGSPSYEQAHAGGIASVLVEQGGNAYAVASYIPIRSTPEGGIEGVFELYTDVTPQMRQLQSTQLKVFGGIAGVLLLLYVVLLLLVRHADRLILRQEEALKIRAHYDALTGLPNRILFRDRLQHAMDRAERDERLVALMFIDMDRFKAINDTLGHEAGDQMLREIARRLQACIRNYDTAARIGGDEFTVILEGVRDIEEVDNIATRIVADLGQPYSLLGKQQYSNASVGITIYPFDDDGMDNLLQNADVAMYRAKQFGGDQFVYYSDAMQKQLMRRHEIEQGLREALVHGHLRLHYQPKIDLRNGRVAGIEALVRWQHPKHGLMLPGEFIPVAEESHLILRLGEWVMRRACEDICRWTRQGIDVPPVAINVSARQFLAPDFLEDMQRALTSCCVSADRVEIEITENILVEQHDETATVLNRLREMGVRVALDDFGTGYSSLRYLQELPVDVVKIDKSFIQHIHDRPDDYQLVRGMVALARSLRQQVVAEGVEEAEQAQLLHEMGCDLAQGFHFSHPLPTDQLPEWLTAHGKGKSQVGSRKSPV